MTEKSSHTQIIHLKINGHTHTRLIPTSLSLLDFIREEITLTGTKRGCDVGDCGCCTVHMNGKPILSCVTLAVEAEGSEIRTIEDIEKNGVLHPVQEAMIEHGAIQCGFCTPAMVMNAVHLLEEKPKPTRQEIKKCISGTICRCTGYTQIEEAIAAAAEAPRK